MIFHLCLFHLQGVDESGDVFRATYAAFICSPISGVLESHGIQKVSLGFVSQLAGYCHGIFGQEVLCFVSFFYPGPWLFWGHLGEE